MANFNALIENTLIIYRCTIFHWKDYQFSDTGEYKDKYWLTLNCKINEFPINIILPTSQYDNHHYSHDINLVDCVIIEKGESQYFNKEKTILDLKNVIKEDEYKIRTGYEEGFLVELGPLEDNLCSRLEKAIEDSDTLDEYEIDELLCRNK